jgi:hypothetical protein
MPTFPDPEEHRPIPEGRTEIVGVEVDIDIGKALALTGILTFAVSVLIIAIGLFW